MIAPPRAAPGMATAAMVCGIAGLPLFFLLVPSVVAVVLGAVALSKARAVAATGRGADGRGRALAGLILGIVGVVAFVVFIVVGAIAGWFDDDTEINELEVGDCVELDVFDEELSTLPVVDCDEPHGGEVYLVEDLFAGEDEFPGQDAVVRRVDEACVAAFEDYVGTPYLESSLELFSASPTRESWEFDDRTAVCFVIRPDGRDLEGSVRNSGL